MSALRFETLAPDPKADIPFRHFNTEINRDKRPKADVHSG